MKPFEYYKKIGEVRETSFNKKEERSLIEDAKKRFDFFSNLNIDENNAKFIFENIYESIRKLLDAALLGDNLKSYSHQANISYAKEKNILSQKDSIILDDLRDKRNKSKYYGTSFELNDLIDKITEAKRIYKIILNYIEEINKK
ncbi:MAG: hypothetical protein QXR96_02025 [Candidatus Woesearchaeota archaeon]